MTLMSDGYARRLIDSTIFGLAIRMRPRSTGHTGEIADIFVAGPREAEQGCSTSLARARFWRRAEHAWEVQHGAGQVELDLVWAASSRFSIVVMRWPPSELKVRIRPRRAMVSGCCRERAPQSGFRRRTAKPVMMSNSVLLPDSA